MTITVYGQPAPQGSKRFVGHAKSGRGILIESSNAVKPWRQSVTCAARDGMRSDPDFSDLDGNTHPAAGPINIHMVFTVPKPKSAPKGRRTWPDRRPDLDKLCRSTIDALTDSGVWEDDSRIVNLSARKCYPNEGDLSLPSPGAVISIEQCTA